MRTVRLFVALTVLGVMSSSVLLAQNTAPWEYWRDTQVPITDFSTATSSITINDNFIITDMQVMVDIEHTAAGDLLIILNGPYGNYVLSQYNGGVYNNFRNTIFDPLVIPATGNNPPANAAIPGVAVNAATNQNGFFRGVYRPQPGTTFPTGVQGQGTWTLQILDNQLNDIGVLKKWGLLFNRYAKYKDVRWGGDLNYFNYFNINGQRYPAPYIEDMTSFSPSGFFPYRVHGYRPQNNQALFAHIYQNSKTASQTRWTVATANPGAGYQTSVDLDATFPVQIGAAFFYALLPSQAGTFKVRSDLYQRGDLFMTREDNRIEKLQTVTAGTLGYDNGTAAGTSNTPVNHCEASTFRLEVAQLLTSVDVWQGSSVELEPINSNARLSVKVFNASGGVPIGQFIATTGLRPLPRQGNKWVTYDFTPPVSLPAGDYAFSVCTEVAPTTGGIGLGLDREGSPFDPDGTLSRYQGLNIEFWSTNAGNVWNAEFLRLYGGKMIRPNFITGSDVGVISIDYPPANLPNSFAPQVTFGSFGNHPSLPNAVTLGKVYVIDNATKQVVRYSERRVFLQNAPYVTTVTFDNFSGLAAGSYSIKVDLERADDENLSNNTYTRMYTKSFAPVTVSHRGPIAVDVRESIVRAYRETGTDVSFVDRTGRSLSLPQGGNVLWLGDMTQAEAQAARAYVEDGNSFAVLPNGSGDLLTSVFSSLATVDEARSMQDAVRDARTAVAPQVSLTPEVENMLMNGMVMTSPTMPTDARSRFQQTLRDGIETLRARMSNSASFAKGGADVRVASFNRSENLTVDGERLGDLSIVRVNATVRKAPPQVVEAIENPNSFELAQNYPNPFNPSTNIAYNLPVDASVSLRVYDMLGREVALVVNAMQSAGRFIATWDGRDNAGETVASGVYLYRMEATPVDGGAPIVSAKRMVLAR